MQKTKTAEQAKLDEKNDNAVLKALSAKKSAVENGLSIAELSEKTGLGKDVARAALKRLGDKVRTAGVARATRYFATQPVAA